MILLNSVKNNQVCLKSAKKVNALYEEKHEIRSALLFSLNVAVVDVD